VGSGKKVFASTGPAFTRRLISGIAFCFLALVSVSKVSPIRISTVKWMGLCAAERCVSLRQPFLLTG